MNARRLYIYFRVRRENEAAAIAAVQELHAGWRATLPGLRCELLERVEEAGEWVTLMETYGCDGGVSAAWQSRIERDTASRLAPWLVGERHVEVFMSCA